MRKILFASVALILLALLAGCGDSTRVAPPTKSLTNTVAFIREAPGGSSVASANQMYGWSVRDRGNAMTKIYQGPGIKPWVVQLDPGTDSLRPARE